MKRVLAGCLAVVAAGAVPAVLGPRPGFAAICQRTVAIQPQESAGEGAGTLTFAVFSYGCLAAGTVAYTIEPGTAHVPLDVVLPDGELAWTAGETGPKEITATIRNDLIPEADLEDFTVELTDPHPAIRVSGSTGHGRILDDDDLWLTWAVDDGSCEPRECLTFDVHDKYYPIQVNVAFTTSSPITVHWSTEDGSAEAGEDFIGVTNRVVTVPAGASRASLPVRFLPRPPGTPSEWFSVQISTPSQGGIVDRRAVITIGSS